MKNIIISLLLPISLLLIVLSGCESPTSTISIPYSSEEYVNGEWEFDDLVKHFEELGFTVEVLGDTTIIEGVYIQNDDLLYESFEKGAEIDASRKIGIYTEISPTLSVDNCSELAEFVEIGIESAENKEKWESFLESHCGQQFEFDGTITDWYDDYFWVAVDFTISIEDSEKFHFSKSNVDLMDLGMTGEYHYNKYHSGLISEGMRVHVLTDISQTENGWELELDYMQIIE